MIKPTKYQDLILSELFIGGHIELFKKKNGVWIHKLVYCSGRKEVIRNDTSKAVQRLLRLKIKIVQTEDDFYRRFKF